MALLTAGFPNIARADLALFSEVLAADVAALRPKPTRYELALACREVRSNCEFLSIAAVIKALTAARKQTGQIDYLFLRALELQGIIQPKSPKLAPPEVQDEEDCEDDE
jgi:hypothetical protein